MTGQSDQGNLLNLAMHLNALFAYAWMRPIDLRKYADAPLPRAAVTPRGSGRSLHD
jgi:hypothetical protein